MNLSFCSINIRGHEVNVIQTQGLTACLHHHVCSGLIGHMLGVLCQLGLFWWLRAMPWEVTWHHRKGLFFKGALALAKYIWTSTHIELLFWRKCCLIMETPKVQWTSCVTSYQLLTFMYRSIFNRIKGKKQKLHVDRSWYNTKQTFPLCVSQPTRGKKPHVCSHTNDYMLHLDHKSISQSVNQ